MVALLQALHKFTVHSADLKKSVMATTATEAAQIVFAQIPFGSKITLGLLTEISGYGEPLYMATAELLKSSNWKKAKVK